jgi:hypothetical protein
MLYTNPVWKFKTFIKESGKDAIREWMEDLPMSAIAAIDTIIRYMEITEKWDSGLIKKLRGYDALYEIIIKDKIGKIQYRIFGCHGPERKEFTLLVGTTHKMNIYNPTDCFKTAEKRYKIFQKNKENVNDYQ